MAGPFDDLIPANRQAPQQAAPRSIPLTGPNPRLQPQIRQEQNQAAASQYAPAAAAQNIRQGEGAIRNTGVQTRNAELSPISALRQEFKGLPIAREFNIARNATRQLQSLAVVPAEAPERAQSDIAMVFNFMKILDPNSVVREQEYATAQNSAGVSEQVRNQYNRLRDGQFLSRKQREGFLKTAQQLYRDRASIYNETANEYRRRYQELGVDPREVPVATPDNGGPVRYQGSGPAPPRPGEVRRGFRFKGGDPASPNSWVKVGGGGLNQAGGGR